jgi:hypothetical protein
LVVSIAVAVDFSVVSLYSVVKQRLKLKSRFQQDGATANTANNSMKYLNENVSSLETYGPFARQILPHQTFICGKQQSLQCIVIAQARLMS